MERELAEMLVEKMVGMSGITGLDKNPWLNTLDFFESDHSQFAYSVNHSKQRVKTTGREDQLSIRRVLDNLNVEQAQNPSPFEMLSDFVFSAIRNGAYNTDSVVNSLQSNEYISEMMKNSDHPYSLLGKMTSWTRRTPRSDLYRIEGPILAIPFVKNNIDELAVFDWMSSNKKYFREEHGRMIPSSKEEFVRSTK